MELINNIRTVARYEAKILRRSWFFRLFSLAALFILSILNLGFFSPIGDENWNIVAFPSSVPLINLYILNIGQAIVVIFLAADFLKRDKKVDTNEVLYTRSMSNFEYIMGKSFGILRLFIGLDIIILMIGLLMNIISKSMTIDAGSYFAYLLILCIPTIVFSLGLAFMLMSVIRNQAITFLILLGLAALDMFWLYDRYGSILDYMAFGLPVVKSTIVGFDDLNLIINQRLIYLFLGLSLVLATVLLFRRLPQSRSHTLFSAIFMVIFLAGAIVCGYNTYSAYRKNIIEKRLVIESNRQYENNSFVSLTNAEIVVTHTKSNITASADLKFVNRNDVPVSSYIFSLNPSLAVSSVTKGTMNVKFRSTGNIIEINPEVPLASGQSDSLKISYSGSVTESFCFPDYTDNIKDNPYRIWVANVNKRQAFLTESYVLLTPESHWYPVPGLNFYPSNPARIKVDYSNYTLRVKDEAGLNPVSQGRMTREGDYSVFRSESPLTGIILAIGDYKSDTLIVDSVKYISYYFPGHDYYKKDLSEIKDTLSSLVSGIMRELETSFSTKYPFKTLGLVEVPVQFYSYPKMNTQTRAELQPSIVLLPEKLSTLANAGFRKRFARQKKRMARNNQVITDKELQVRLFNDFVRNAFISGENFRYINGVVLNEPIRYRLGPSFYFFKNNFYSTEYPVINAVFESHLQKVIAPVQNRDFFFNAEGLSDIDKPNLILRNISFRDLLAKNPKGDTIRTVLTVKGDYLFNLLRERAGISEFNKWLSVYLDDNKFQSVDIRKLNSDIKNRFGFEFYSDLSDWFNGKSQPGFLFSGLQVMEIVVDDRSRYQVTFNAFNPEPEPGLFNVSVRSAGGSGQPGQQSANIQVGGAGASNLSGQGRGIETGDLSRIVFLGPGQAKKTGIIIDVEPREILINTIFSRNLPGEIVLPVTNIIKSKERTKGFEGEELLSSLPFSAESGDIIVDNEDPGFKNNSLVDINLLKKILGINKKIGEVYGTINNYYQPEFWQPVLKSSYYGKYVLSSVYTRSGSGDRSVTWKTKISQPGYYDIYCFIGKTEDRVTVRAGSQNDNQQQGGGEPGRDNLFRDIHYKIYNDEGIDEITVDFENASAGWNILGRYYLSADTAKVVLTNKSAGKAVIGDAIKWVKAK